MKTDFTNEFDFYNISFFNICNIEFFNLIINFLLIIYTEILQWTNIKKISQRFEETLKNPILSNNPHFPPQFPQKSAINSYAKIHFSKNKLKKNVSLGLTHPMADS